MIKRFSMIYEYPKTVNNGFINMGKWWRVLYPLVLVFLIACSQKDLSLPPVPGWYYRAKKGESLREIATRYGFEEEVLRRLNSVSPGKRFGGGELIFIPASAVRKKPHPPKQSPSRPTLASAKTKISVANAKKVKTSKTSKKTSTRYSKNKTLTKKYSKNKSHSTTRSAKSIKPRQKFIMPVNGKITRKFFKRKSAHHYGIDIAAPEGTPIRASRSGKVIYSDNVIPGFGNMVILDHNDGFTTLYAHNKKNLVKVNQFVKQGTKIALVGHSGNATGNHLHFEIRYNAEPVDPMKYLTHTSGKK
ncbi:M23 family metallopeptidase [Candidatus Sumerlaeota bacterium]|nr:M23 family metallopeptidase [Candidatus Sumerlaeota bacterium]